MGGAATGNTMRWVWAAASAVVAGSLVVLLFSLAAPPAPVPAMVPARARPIISRTARKEETTLLDPTPLYLPTEWSAAQKEVPWPEPGGAFQSYRVKPKFIFAETEPKLGLPAPIAIPAKAADALAEVGSGALALGFGRGEAVVEPLSARGAFVEIVAMRTGRPALPPRVMAQVQKLAAEARPPGNRPWQPVAYLAAVDPAGLVGPLVIVEPRSGVDEVDNYFQNYLVKTLRLGERLTPGSYRISVGP